MRGWAERWGARGRGTLVSCRGGGVRGGLGRWSLGPLGGLPGPSWQEGVQASAGEKVQFSTANWSV